MQQLPQPNFALLWVASIVLFTALFLNLELPVTLLAPATIMASMSLLSLALLDVTRIAGAVTRSVARYKQESVRAVLLNTDTSAIPVKYRPDNIIPVFCMAC